MEIAPYFGGLVSAIVFALTAWIALKSKWENRFAKIEIKQASQDEKIQQAVNGAQTSQDLTIQITQITTKLDMISNDVKKSNEIIERVAVLERDTKTAFEKIDDLRDELHEYKVGGTN